MKAPIPEPHVMPRISLSLMVATALFTAALAGCHCAPKVPASPPPAPVDVGGVVKSPGTVAIPREGLTLLQAFIRAGGLKEYYQRGERPSEDLIQELLVSLRRGREVHYFPL